MRDYILHQAEMREQTFALPWVHRLVRNWRARRQLKILEKLDDHILLDIGFTREGLRRSFRLPHSVDPFAEVMEARQRAQSLKPRRGR
jgi:uncharacterized protein YjiS (DUF1127 family)